MRSPIWKRLHTTIHFLMWVYTAGVVVLAFEPSQSPYSKREAQAGEAVVYNSETYGYDFIRADSAKQYEPWRITTAADWNDQLRHSRKEWVGFTAFFLLGPWILLKWLEWLFSPRDTY